MRGASPRPQSRPCLPAWTLLASLRCLRLTHQMRETVTRRTTDGTAQVQADLAGPPLHVGVGLRRGDEDRAGEEPARAAEEDRRPEQVRADHAPTPGRRAQAPLP